MHNNSELSQSPPSPRVPATRDAINQLILPEPRERLRTALLFLAVALSVYTLLAAFGSGPDTATRVMLNAGRCVVLFACVWALGGEGSRRHWMWVTFVALITIFSVGALLAILRGDLLPMIVLGVAITCTASVLIPWGWKAQAAMGLSNAVAILVASLVIERSTGGRLSLEAAATVGNVFLVTPFIAAFLERNRHTLEVRLEEARRNDEELAQLRHRLERRVTERTAELEMANGELEGFSYTVSHDLRSPLRTISGFSQLIVEDEGESISSCTQTNLIRIQAASNRMDALIDDMLRLARIGRTALQRERVDLAELARLAVKELSALEPARKVVVHIAEIPVVLGDHALLRIAIANLLGNAWKFTQLREDAVISVSGERSGTNVVCRVRDNGMGFDSRFRHKLFKPFERIHDAPDLEGTGVGLATVARVVRRHGGEVDAEGRVGDGATFSMTLPSA